jgi:tRNA A37 threonylcarbamoyladenosine dehydratase
MTNIRLQGIKKLYGNLEFARLQKSHVAVIGIGGVGSWVAESLVRSGIGKITLIDMDEICESNTNRQLHALDGNYGRSKVEATKERLLKINPDAEIMSIFHFVTAETLNELITPQFDYVIDCIDSLTNKCLIAHHCLTYQIPLLVMGGVGGKIDPTKILISDLNKSFNDSLLYRMRKKLKRDFHFTREKKKNFGITCVFSPEDVRYLQNDGTITCAPNGENGKLDCEGGLGTASFMTGTFAFVGVSFVVKSLITGR